MRNVSLFHRTLLSIVLFFCTASLLTAAPTSLAPYQETVEGVGIDNDKAQAIAIAKEEADDKLDDLAASSGGEVIVIDRSVTTVLNGTVWTATDTVEVEVIVP